MQMTKTTFPVAREIRFRSGGHYVAGTLTIPFGAIGAVAFAHDSGTARHNALDEIVAGKLRQARIATLLEDLLDPLEAKDRTKVFDFELATSRLLATAAWLRSPSEPGLLPFGCFASGISVAAALAASAHKPSAIAAIIGRGGRPDRALSLLPRVCAPTLLIVAEHDPLTLPWNREACSHLQCENRIVIVPGADHTFEQAEAAECLATQASLWFTRHFIAKNAARADYT